MPRLPSLRFRLKQGVFEGQRVRTIDECVHTIRIGIQCRFGIVRTNIVVSGRYPTEVAPPHQLVKFYPGVAQIFAGPAEPAQPVAVHLP